MGRLVAAAETQAQFSTGSLLLILAPSTLALLGVIFSTLWTARQAARNERLRAQAAVGAELFAERRRAELQALRLVADAAGALHDFHESMYGRDEADERTAEAESDGKDREEEDSDRDSISAAAIDTFFEKFQRMSSLEECALEIAAYGSAEVAAKIEDIAYNIGEYFVSLGDDIPIFVAQKAISFEAELKRNFDELVDLVRADLGVEHAQQAVWGQGKRARHGRGQLGLT